MYKIKLDNDNYYHESVLLLRFKNCVRIINMASQWQKPMPTCCIKEHPALSWLKFNLLLKTVHLDDKIGYLFVVDIEFDKKRGTEHVKRDSTSGHWKTEHFRDKWTISLATFRFIL